MSSDIRKNPAYADESTYLVHKSTAETPPFATLDHAHHPRNLMGARLVVLNFTVFSCLAATNVCCVLACMALATARLGSIGASQSGVLYTTYTLSALIGATYVVKKLGARNGMVLGMSLYCIYLLTFTLAIMVNDTHPTTKVATALLGAAVGGVGGGVFWTSQGAYFAQAAEEHALFSGAEWAQSTSLLAGIFAAIYLLEEALLHLLSSLLAQRDKAWSRIFAIYVLIAILSTIGMTSLVKEYPSQQPQHGRGSHNATFLYKLTATWQLLRYDSKMKYMMGLNAVFGFSAAFMNSFVSGQVVRIVLHDTHSKYVGVLAALCAVVAAVCSLGFHHMVRKRRSAAGKGPILMVGAIAFMCVVLLFLTVPDLSKWTLSGLLLVYSLQGVGRATFESTLKSVFADFFAYEREGAFANIEFQNGLSSAIGYLLSFRMTCSSPNNPYCIPFRDGSLHSILILELFVITAGVLAMLGFWRAFVLFVDEERSGRPTRLATYRRDSVTSYRSSLSRMSGHIDDATFAAFEQYDGASD